MATGGDLDEGLVKRCDAAGALDDCNRIDDPGSDSSEEERATSESDNSFVLNINASILQIGRDNLLNFRSVDDPILSENPSKVKSGDEGGPVLRELSESVSAASGEEERASSGSGNAIVINVVNPCIMQIGSDNVLNFSPVENSTPSRDFSNITGDNQPVLREHWKPRGVLSVGRSRLGFPDCDNDHLVQLLVCKNQHTREALDLTDNYDVTVAVSYDGASASSLTLPDYQCKRIKSRTMKSHTNGAMVGVVGYLFRFHEPDTKYQISFSLNTTPSKGRGEKKSVMEHTACKTICQISVTLETGPMISSKSGKAKEKAKESTVSPLFGLSPPCLSKESTMLYKRSWWVANQLRSCRNSLKSEDFNKHASDLLLKFTDADTQVAIKLERSMHASDQNQPDRALQLMDEAFNFMSEAINPQLMAGRGYVYQAEIMRRQGNLGKAEHCVNLAGQNIAACQTSLDTGLIAWERARILTDFIGRTPHRSLKLVNETRSNLEKCFDVCLHVETENSNLFVKQLLVLVFVAMPILLLDSDSDVARNRTLSQKFIGKAQWCLDTLRNKYWSEMTLSDRVYFYLSSSDLEYRRSNFTEAEEFGRLAKDMAVEMGLNIEACKAQERLDFMSVITRGHTIGNGTQQSESEGENADISSLEADSDWLAAILN